MKDPDSSFDAPVLIVGAGPAGLTASLLLARAGTRSLLVERRGGLSVLPRATGINVRTMEIFRSIGIADRVAASSMDSRDLPLWVQVETLRGPALASLTPQGPQGVPSTSYPTPAAHVQCAQDRLEPILYDEVRRYPHVEIRFDTELVALHQDADCVIAELEDRRSNCRYRVRAAYAVGADGANSVVRAAVGVAMSGEEHLGRELNILFEADLASLVQGHRASLYLVHSREMEGIFRPVDEERRWTLTTRYVDDPTAERCVQFIRTGAGEPSIQPRIVAVGEWELAAAVADRFSAGRVFLIGDAAHRMTPGGALGMNTAVQDAHNLAWKLAAVVDGWGGPALLDTYHMERHPVAEQNVALSWEIWQDMSKAQRTLGAVLGFSYQSAAVIPDGTEPPTVANPVSDFVPSARPGSRAPHHWLEQGNRRISTLDLFGRSFVLLTGQEGHGWCEAAERFAEMRHVPLQAVRIATDGEYQDPERTWAAMYGVDETGAVLVRPDGHVAWRRLGPSSNPKHELDSVVTMLLGTLPTDTAGAVPR